jgi:putative iron-regulated protein
MAGGSIFMTRLTAICPRPGCFGLVLLAFALINCADLAFSLPARNLISAESDLPALKRAVVSNYAAIASASYQDALAATETLQRAITRFLEKPSESSLKAARAAWITARIPYSQTETFRFYDGPIDEVEGWINSWPIDENYIDYVKENPDAGIINDTTNFPTLSAELIVSLNEKEGKKNISTGFHAIEFLLWGQDLSTNGPGDRSWRDYADGARNADRRRQYLSIITALLAKHLSSVAAQWSEKTDDYLKDFLAVEPDIALGRILKGAGALSGPEVAGERLTTPYETKDQEDDQDCFSDNTRDDLTNDGIGIRNIYFGQYEGPSGTTVEGPGLHDLLLRTDPELAKKLAGQVETAVTCARNIPQPFDQAILGVDTAPGRIAIKQTITAFQTESDLIARAARVLSIKLTLR